MRETFME